MMHPLTSPNAGSRTATDTAPEMAVAGTSQMARVLGARPYFCRTSLSNFIQKLIAFGKQHCGKRLRDGYKMVRCRASVCQNIGRADESKRDVRDRGAQVCDVDCHLDENANDVQKFFVCTQ